MFASARSGGGGLLGCAYIRRGLYLFTTFTVSNGKPLFTALNFSEICFTFLSNVRLRFWPFWSENKVRKFIFLIYLFSKSCDIFLRSCEE